MGATRNTGYLENIIAYDASNNVAIATSVNPSYKVTLGGSLSGTSATFSTEVTSSGSQGRFGGWATGAGYQGAALEAGVSGGTATLLGYNRTTSAYIPLTIGGNTNQTTTIGGNTIVLQNNGVTALSIASTGAATFSSSVTAGTETNITGTSVNSRLLVTAAGVANTVLGFNNSGATTTGVTNNTSYVGVLQAYPLVFITDSTERLRISSTGAATFSSSVTAVGLSSTTSANGNLNTYIRNTVTAASGVTGYGLAIESEASAATSYALTVRNLAGSNTYFHISTETGKVGNVGIGTTSPLSILHILGQSGTTGLPSLLLYGESPATGQRYGFNVSADQLDISALGTNGRIAFFTGGNASTAASQERMRITSGGNVYIGSTSGDYGKLDITVSPSSYTAALGLGIQTNSGEGNSVGISFKTKISLSGAIWENARIAVFTDGVTSSAYGSMAFYTMNATTLTERMRITSGGVTEFKGTDSSIISRMVSSSGMLQFYPYHSAYGGPIIQALNAAQSAYYPLRVECTTMTVSGNQTVTGTKSFAIEHPLNSKKTLLHYSTESPKADLIYRGKVNLVDGKAEVNIDLSSKMTDGTFVALCRNVQCFTTNETGWDMVKGKVIGNILTIESDNKGCADEISWMVIGERYDESIKKSNMLDGDGDLIVEQQSQIEELKSKLA